MKILLAGGSSSFMNNLITKFKKEGHKVYLLTGNRYSREYYQKAFERYDFPYDCQNLDDIYETVNPDAVIYTGMYDTNYHWYNEEKEAVSFINGLNSLLMGFRKRGRGKFIYLSSEIVYSGNYTSPIKEGTAYSAKSTKGMAAAQAEELVKSYYTLSGLDTVILRLGSMFSIPESSFDMYGLFIKMVYEAVNSNSITIRNKTIAPLFESDAISRIFTFTTDPNHSENEYNISGNQLISDDEMANLIIENIENHPGIINTENNREQIKLDGERFDTEFGNNFYCDIKAVLKRVIDQVKKNKFEYRTVEEKEKKEKKTGLWQAIIPFVENVVFFVLILALTWFTRDVSFLNRIDFFLIYVLLFAIVHGQNQAIFSGVLSMVGYYILESQMRSGVDVVMDASTYIWIAEIFILGLSVGFLHDNIEKIKKEHEADTTFYDMQLADMKDINTSNVRVKDALETQIVSQSDSVGKIYSITSSLNQYSPEEVLFYAADMIARLMKSRDVSIYNVVNSDFARLFSFTSPKAKTLGNSIKYSTMGEMYNTLKDKKVFINRKLDERYPLMASAVYNDEGEMQLIIMIWTMTWENMTLGQANQLVVIGALIQNAVVRSTRYLDALETTRYHGATKALSADAFSSLKTAYLTAASKGLTSCLLVKCNKKPEEDQDQYIEKLSKLLRQTDYVGIENDNIYILLANTDQTDSSFVTNRLNNAGIECEIVE